LISSLEVQNPPPLMTSATGILWVRLAALCLGLTCLFGGVGVALGLAAVSDPEGSGFWSLGLIPVFVGFGLLLFHRLSRNVIRTGDGDAAE
jgi:hypothetical protein